MDILKEYMTDQIYIRYALDEKPDGRKYDFHVHDTCEIFYFLEGDAEYLVEASSYPLEPGSLMIMRPGEAHCIRFHHPEKYTRYAVNFPLSLFDSFDPKRLLMKPYLDRELGQGNLFLMPGLESVFEAMCDASLDNYSRTVVLTSKIQVLLDLINTECRQRKIKPPAPQSLAEQAVSYVNRHIFDRISVTSLAEHFYLSKSQFCRIFKNTTGASPWDYITAKRLIAAKTMIARGSSAKTAAESCGFHDYSVFYRAYLKRFGTSPAKASSAPGIIPPSV